MGDVSRIVRSQSEESSRVSGESFVVTRDVNQNMAVRALRWIFYFEFLLHRFADGSTGARTEQDDLQNLAVV